MKCVGPSQKILPAIFLTIFIDMLGLGILIPVFPLLIIRGSEFRVIPSSWSDSEGLIMAGWLLASFSIAQFLFSPLLGQLSDKYGRRKVLSLSIFGTASSYLLFAIAIYLKNIPLMFCSRILDGITGGNISIAQAVIGDISEPQNRARNFGLVGVSIGIGFVFGPFLGGKLSDPNICNYFDAATPFVFASLLSLTNGLLILKTLPETLAQVSNREVSLIKPINNIYKIFQIASLRQIIPALFLFNAGFTFFTTFWGVVLADQFSFSQGQVGDFFAYSGIMIILAQGGVIRRISGKVTDYKILYFSIIGTGIALIMNYLIPATNPRLIYAVPPIIAICVAATKAFSSALITRLTPSDRLGEAMGINSSANALAQAIPSLLSGYIAAQYARLPVLVGAITTIIGGILFIIVFKQKTR